MKTIYEERYNKALESAKRELESCGTLDCDAAKQIFRIFPELAENEDERISREITKFLVDYYNGEYERPNENTIDSWLSWLKKQGEQKSVISDDALREGIAHFGITQYQIDNWLKKYVEVEKQSKQKHKFNIGDIISNGQAVFRVDNITKNCIGQDCYFLVNVEYEKKGIRYHILIDSQGNRSHLGEITWLCEQVDELFEKQGKQKPADKIEPKFKEGDYVANDDSSIVAQIEGVSTSGYYYTFKNIKPSISYSAPNCEFVDKYYHLWTIEDAKDGDVLAFDWTQDNGASHWQKIVIFKGLNKDGIEGYGNTFKNGKLVLQEEVPFYSKTWTMTLQPATKEQRDFLFQKMHEAGYEWDAENKQVRKNSSINF